MVRSVTTSLILLIFGFTLTSSNLLAQCSDEVVWAEPEEILEYGVDSTGHWWVISAPYEDFKNITIDGETFGPFNDIRALTFHRTGETWAFIARNILKSIIVTPDGRQEFVQRIDSVFFPAESTELWWTESVGLDRRITNGSRSYTVTFPIADVKLHPLGIVTCWVEQRPGVEVLMRNGAEVARGDRIDLAGVWVDGTTVHSINQSGRVSVWQGATELASNLARVTSLSMNFSGTVMAWAEFYQSTGPRVKMYSPDMRNPWESPPLENVSGPVALSPQSELISFRARRANRSLVFFNGAEYPAGERAGNPFYSNEGDVMAYATENAGNYIAVNGKLFLLKSAAPIGNQVAIAPSGEQVSWSTSSTILMEDLDFTILRTGRMCDRMSPTVYSGRDRAFLALGIITNRVYLMSCRAR